MTDTENPITEYPVEAKNTEGEESAEAAPVDVPPMPSWSEQDDLLREMWLNGVSAEEMSRELRRSIAAIMTRAVRLGLPRRSMAGRKRGGKNAPRDPSKPRKIRAMRRRFTPRYDESTGRVIVDPSTRVCLMCLIRFHSDGRHNRICPSCKATVDYAAACATPDVGLNEEG